jgi:hypothetical protein
MHLTTDLWGMVGRADDSIITEIKDRQSLQLLRVAGISHFVISDELISMMTVHLARNPSLHHFWIDHVFSNGSSEFAIVPVNRYIDYMLSYRPVSRNTLVDECWLAGPYT